MILETIYGCDGCKRKLNKEQLDANLPARQTYFEAHAGFNCQHVTEVFCAACLPFAGEYWDIKPQILADALEVSKNRVDNHRRDFFTKRTVAQQRQLKAVK